MLLLKVNRKRRNDTTLKVIFATIRLLFKHWFCIWIFVRPKMEKYSTFIRGSFEWTANPEIDESWTRISTWGDAWRSISLSAKTHELTHVFLQYHNNILWSIWISNTFTTDTIPFITIRFKQFPYYTHVIVITDSFDRPRNFHKVKQTQVHRWRSCQPSDRYLWISAYVAICEGGVAHESLRVALSTLRVEQCLCRNKAQYNNMVNEKRGRNLRHTLPCLREGSLLKLPGTKFM